MLERASIIEGDDACPVQLSQLLPPAKLRPVQYSHIHCIPAQQQLGRASHERLCRCKCNADAVVCGAR